MIGLTRRHLLAVLGAGILLRVAVFGLFHFRVDTGDAEGYDLMARNLVHHHIFSVSPAPPFEAALVRPPAYPFFLAFFEVFFPGAVWPAQVGQVLLSLIPPFLLYAVARKYWPKAAVPVLWATMLSPFDAFYVGAHLSETLCTTLLVGGIAMPLLEPKRLRGWAIGGVLLGLCALTRDIYLPLLLMLSAAGGWVITAVPNRKLPLVLGLAGLMTIGVWTVRNRVTTGQTVPISKGNLGFNLWAGTWERDGNWVAERGTDFGKFPDIAYASDAERARVAAIVHDEPKSELDRGFRDLAVARIKAAPVGTALLWIRRLPRPWLGTRSDLFELRPGFLQAGHPLWYLFKSGLYALNLLIVVCGAIGLVLERRNRTAWWLAAPIILNFLIYIPFHNSETRYTQPIYPLVVFFAALFGERVWTWWQLRRGAAPAAAADATS